MKLADLIADWFTDRGSRREARKADQGRIIRQFEKQVTLLEKEIARLQDCNNRQSAMIVVLFSEKRALVDALQELAAR